MKGKYSYRPLENGQHTRIIQLHPAQNHKDQLRCDLIHFKHGDGPYDAISYAWKESKRRGTKAVRHSDADLLIRESTKSLVLKITPSLENALRALRSKTETIHLWADAVCINQEDNEEKSIQVKGMSGIYTNARMVRLWLGKNYYGAEGALSMVDAGQGSDLPEDILTNFRKILLRPWFQRRWVIQEALLAQNARIHCGDISMDFHQFAIKAWEISLVLKKRGPDFLFTQGYGRAYDMVDTIHWGLLDRQRNSAFFPIYRLLHDFRAARCYDDRDRIYALLGLCDEKAHIEITYEKSTDEVYAELTLALWKSSTRQLPPCVSLHYAGAFRSSDVEGSTLPSWVPDWRASRRFQPFHPSFNPPTPKATLYHPRFIQINGIKGLILPGYKIHTIQGSIKHVFQPVRSPVHSLGILRSRLSKWVSQVTPATKAETWADPLLAMMQGLLDAHKELLELNAKGFVKKLVGAPNELSDQRLEKYLLADVSLGLNESNIQALLDGFYESMDGRIFIRFDEQPGLSFNVPEDTRDGDEVWVFDEEDTPFILRPAKDSGGSVGYRVMGDVGTTWKVGKHFDVLRELGIEKEWEEKEIVII
ncbi:heterokaryon incompatibility protein-domain-containing protein [Podospora fimiseda]|uniref:Heterokaryon incompatibility protein-domain-containing protein n=1 Tax=Podospora fimiseda TaxID=252190 RepID=A0AAN6YMN6_9PEZI|nr:heterokaryon incompatibility protein-domain-containing protein [Podospora fimiseda]